MTEDIRMTKEIDNFVRGDMDIDKAILLLQQISKSDKWIDHLLLEMELSEYYMTSPRKVYSSLN